MWIDAIATFDKFCKEETPMEKLHVLLRTIRICSSIFEMASLKADEMMTADDELMMMTYVVSRSTSSSKLYSNY